MKAGKAHSMPLARPVRELLAELPREQGNPHLFVGRWPGTHVSSGRMFEAWDRLRVAAGLQGVTPHDLRRTVGSWLAQAGVPLLTIGKALAHTSPGVTAIYARLGEDHLRAPMEQHAERILAAGLLAEPQP
jgi:integrase